MHLCVAALLVVPFLIGDIRASFFFLRSNSSGDGVHINIKPQDLDLELGDIDTDVAEEIPQG